MLTKQLAPGFSLVEIIIAISLMVIIVAGAVVAVVGSFSSTRLAKEQVVATQLAEEGLEAIQSIRNEDWDNLTIGTHGLSNSGSWSLSGSSDTTDDFTRQVTIAEVQRDGSGDIVSSGGTVDPETKVVTVVVDWDVTPTRSNQVSLQQYLTNWQEGQGAGSGGSPSPSPSPSPTSCATYCQSVGGYSTGTCRANTNQCTQNGETYQAGGNTYCTGGGGSDTCCCAN